MAEAIVPRDWWKAALFTVAGIIMAGSAIGWLSGSGHGNGWFDALLKPPFMPPGWVFPVAWTILYGMMGASLAIILAEPASRLRAVGLTLFFLQLGLNFAWPPIFFGAHDMELGSLVILAMLVLAVAAAATFRRIRPLAGWLLLPYLLWLCFAWTLNNTIDALNPGVGTSLVDRRR
jgi:translocator protein